ncbi:uncharacterized protein BDZ99DRAFT_527309 [Mytilinidion resinicola]|uniref:Uncharacterized protein n=1 Tax=Mytilinidion resinicola TaxID=574789 RepID=A0A6A6Y199_9PEZI|nr:uncharacterized protein BDZ99DRAFT_527309 [Mytilinidion resinicola]KAF2802581.1 hypothetical protein BDZ99DRAFT_527309 [Mytilinidion resinicola]
MVNIPHLAGFLSWSIGLTLRNADVTPIRSPSWPDILGGASSGKGEWGVNVRARSIYYPTERPLNSIHHQLSPTVLKKLLFPRSQSKFRISKTTNFQQPTETMGELADQHTEDSYIEWMEEEMQEEEDRAAEEARNDEAEAQAEQEAGEAQAEHEAEEASSGGEPRN